MVPHHPTTKPFPYLYSLVEEKKNTLQCIKVTAVMGPIFSDEIPFCLFFKAIFVQLFLLISTDILRPQYGSWNGCFIIVKEFLENKHNVINNQIIVIFYTPFIYNCHSWIEIWKCNMPVQHTVEKFPTLLSLLTMAK